MPTTSWQLPHQTQGNKPFSSPRSPPFMGYPYIAQKPPFSSPCGVTSNIQGHHSQECNTSLATSSPFPRGHISLRETSFLEERPFYMLRSSFHSLRTTFLKEHPFSLTKSSFHSSRDPLIGEYPSPPSRCPFHPPRNRHQRDFTTSQGPPPQGKTSTYLKQELFQ